MEFLTATGKDDVLAAIANGVNGRGNAVRRSRAGRGARRIVLASSFQLKAEAKPRASGSMALAESLTEVVDSIKLNQDCGGAFP